MRGLTVTGERGIMNHRQVALTKAWTRGEDREPLGGNRALVLLDLPASQPDPPRVFYLQEAMATGEDLPSCARQRQPVHHGLKRGIMPIVIRGTRLSYLPSFEAGQLGLQAERNNQRAWTTPNYCISAPEKDDRTAICSEARHKVAVTIGADKAIVPLLRIRKQATR